MATGHRKLLEQFEADGITHIFGNPGSSEEGLVDELTQFESITYLLGLQEAALLLTANGYAMATRKPTVAQLHCSVGVGNALGSLYHVLRKQRAPLVVIAGEAGVGEDALEAHMSLDLVGFARPVTKYATRAIDSRSVLRLARRCIKIAATPPFGPTFLAIPQDVLDQQNDETVVPTVIPDTRVTPSAESIRNAAAILSRARRPVIIVGDGVAHADAKDELEGLAETLGAGVWGAMASELIMAWTHPLYLGLTGHMFGNVSRESVEHADAVLIVGTYVFPDVFGDLESPFAASAKVIHIDLATFDIAKSHPVALGIMGDPKAAMAELITALSEVMTQEQTLAAMARSADIGNGTRIARANAIASDDRYFSSEPLHMCAFTAQLASHVPDDVIIVDEALTNSSALTRYLPPHVNGHFFQTPGGTLGIGFPGAIGVKLANPGKTVIGFSGDGGAIFTIQALWTAAHYRIGAKFVVCNNRSYRILKNNLAVYRAENNVSPSPYPPSFDISDPPVDFVKVAEGFGVRSMRVVKAGDIAPAIDAMLADDGPFLIDLVLENESA